jgi:16S rRNA (cytosine1402-N4)-methyltransferase
MHQPNSYHEPVMAEEVMNMFTDIKSGVIVDATFGGGGHTRRFLNRGGLDVIGLDQDPDAVANTADLADNEHFSFVRGSFGDLAQILDAEGIETIDGVLFDLGVSSHQLDEPTRGFSYRHPGPLDMRMGDGPLTAAAIVNEWSEADLARVIREYGEERFSVRIARAICQARPIADTASLASIVREAIPAATRKTGGHPARRTFQALRIAVNDELGELERGIDAAIEHLAPHGRCVVISYHSLEDRIVKQRFASAAQTCVCPPGLPVCACNTVPELIIVTRKALGPTEAEVASNPRARSAKLRCAQKVAA